MSDQAAPEGQSGDVEQAAPPVPAFASRTSTAAASAPTFDREKKFSGFLEQYKDEVDQLVEKRAQAKAQSLTDKRLSFIDRTPGGVSAFKDYMKAKGADPAVVDAALRDMQRDERDAAVDQLLFQVGNAVSGRTAVSDPTPDPTSDVQAWTAEILSDAGVNWNTDMAYKVLAAKPYTSPEQFKTAVTKFVAQKAKQAFQPGAATNATTTGGAAPNATNKAERINQLYERLAETQLAPTKNAAERTKIKAELATLE